MQYYIGQSTWGHPILWQREQSNGCWIGAIEPLNTISPELITNYSNYQFVLWLQAYCRLGDWVYCAGASFHRAGWYSVIDIGEWCCYYHGPCGKNNLNYLDIIAHADSHKNTITFADHVQWRDTIIWKLYGF